MLVERVASAETRDRPMAYPTEGSLDRRDCRREHGASEDRAPFEIGPEGYFGAGRHDDEVVG
jgi:hypothetical protein